MSIKAGQWVTFRKGSDAFRRAVVEIGYVLHRNDIMQQTFDVDSDGVLLAAVKPQDLITLSDEQTFRWFDAERQNNPGILQWANQHGMNLDLNSLRLEDPSGYTTAFTHPDPLDPNDAQRQRTQARADDYPYDSPVMYGRPVGTDMGGASYQRVPDATPPSPQGKKIVKPKDVWEQLEDLLAPYEPGSQADDAKKLGYGCHDVMGDGGMSPQDLDMDALRQDFRDTFLGTLPKAQSLGSKGLFSLLVQVDPEYSSELFAPDDDSEMTDIYNDWGHHVYAPGAEDDPE